MLKISSILDSLLSNNLVSEAEKVLNWPEACNETGIIHILSKHDQPGLIETHLSLTKIDITQSEFLEVFEKGYFKACVKMLESKDPRGVLTKEKIQISLIELLETGDQCLEAIQILSFINARD